MQTARTFAEVLTWIGRGLLVAGVALWLFLFVIGISRVGPGGCTVAILFGCGLSVWLLAVLVRLNAVSVQPITDTDTEADSERKRSLAELRVRRAKIAVYYAALTTVMAIALYAIGVPVAFIGFDFAKGINDFGFIIIFSGLAVGVIAVLGGLVAFILSGINAIGHGHFKWFLATIVVLVFQVATFLVIRSLIH